MTGGSMFNKLKENRQDKIKKVEQEPAWEIIREWDYVGRVHIKSSFKLKENEVNHVLDFFGEQMYHLMDDTKLVERHMMENMFKNKRIVKIRRNAGGYTLLLI